MDQHLITLYLFMRGLSAKAIHQKHVRTLGAGAIAYPTVRWYLRGAKLLAQSKGAPDEPGVTRTDSVDATILKALTNNPFSSVRELSRLTCLSRSILHRRLTESFGFTVRHLHRIPRWLSDDQSQLVSRTPTKAAKSANPRVARHFDSG
jgi:hypothetical protein